ncbi:MAG: GNAT family N-acetyltransferase [Pirellulales bacterium]
MPITFDPPAERETPAGTSRARVHCALALDEVDALETSWREMHSDVPNPLGQFNWTRACLAAFPADSTPHVVAATAGARLLALAPLVQKRRHGVCRLYLAGAGELLEPMDLVWTDAKACARVFQSLARSGAPLVFERVPANSLSVPLLRRAYFGRALVSVSRGQPCAYLALNESWLVPECQLPPDDQAALVRARRAAEALGQVTTEIHAPDLRDLASVLDEAFDVESSGWPADAAVPTSGRPTPLSRDPQRAVFYLQYARAACVEGVLRVCFLRIDGRAVAMQIAVESGGAFWLLRAGHDPEFTDCRPDQLLARETIRYAAESGLASYELLCTADDTYRKWRPQQRACVAVNVYPLSLRGLAALLADLAVATHGRWRAPIANAVQALARLVSAAMMHWV